MLRAAAGLRNALRPSSIQAARSDTRIPVNAAPPVSIALLVALAAPTPSKTQAPPAEALARLTRIEGAVGRVASAHLDGIWPGFHPESVPVLFVVPHAGVLLVNWRSSDLPEDFGPLAGMAHAGWRPADLSTAASTGTTLAGASAAQVFVAAGMSDALLFGTVVHEAFHVFERAAAREDRRFGSGENSFLVSSYPIFDPANEAGVALEGRLLARALAAGTRADLAARAQEFLAAREARHRTLGSEYADFEVMGELNEGLAEYALVRALELAASDAALPWRRDAAGEVERHRERLDSLSTDVSQSLRLRFYVTGPAMGLILDRLAGPAWRADLMRRDLTLQDALADAAGYRERERALLARATQAMDTAALGRDARAAIERLRVLRRRQVDSVLTRPGLMLVLRSDSLGGGRFGLCGIDPQNLLQVDAGVLLHTRWVRPCAGDLSVEFTTATIQDRRAGTFTAVVGAEDSVRVTAGGSPVTLRDGQTLLARDLEVVAPGATLTAGRAALARTGRSLEIAPVAR
jgi:hypothetical protein